MSDHVGRRGAFLALFGLVYLLIGYSYTGSRTTPAVRQSLHLATNVMPIWAYGVIWLSAGMIALAFGLLFDPAKDALGFVAAIVMPALWSFIYLCSWVEGYSPRGWSTAALFLLVAGAVAVVSGMPNPVDVEKVAASHRMTDEH